MTDNIVENSIDNNSLKNDSGIGVDKETVEHFFVNNVVYLPKYQREYSWQKRNIKTLIDDIISNNDYYIGNLMYSKKDEYIELIDGQQRLITIYLILSALCQAKGKNKQKIVQNFDEKLLYKDSENITRFIIDDRTADQNTKVFSYICKERNPSDEIKKTNEYKQFKFIKSFIKKFDDAKINLLYENLKRCQFVFIDTTNSKIKAEKVFLNLNTKGIKLSDESIVKSLLFSSINVEKDFDSMRNSWFEAFHSMPETEQGTYLTDYISIFETDKKSKIRKPEIVPTFEKIVKDGKSMATYEKLAKSDSVYLAAHNAIVHGKSDKYIELFNDTTFKMDYFFHIVNYLRKFNFTQFDIALKSLLYFENDSDKKKIKNDYNLIISYIKLIYLFYVIQGLKNTSPSFYGNEFVRFAVEMRNKSNLKTNIQNSISVFKIVKITNNDLNFLDDIKVEQNSKELKYIAALISFLDEDPISNYTGEHFIPVSSGKDGALSFENIIPVSFDNFGSEDEQTKVEAYLKIIPNEKHIDIFLKKDYYSDFEKKIKRSDYAKYRKERYKSLFVNCYNAMIDALK